MFDQQTPTYRKGRIKGSNIDLMGTDFAIDTALSWDGEFPKPGKGDYLVVLGDIYRGNVQVLVSRRYTSASDHDNAASIALDAFSEQCGYGKDDEGNIKEIKIPGFGTGTPCWVERVETVF